MKAREGDGESAYLRERLQASEFVLNFENRQTDTATPSGREAVLLGPLRDQAEIGESGVAAARLVAGVTRESFRRRHPSFCRRLQVQGHAPPDRGELAAAATGRPVENAQRPPRSMGYGSGTPQRPSTERQAGGVPRLPMGVCPRKTARSYIVAVCQSDRYPRR
jgi:hypothetical protein